MSRGIGDTQKFILSELSSLEDGQWMPIVELAKRYAAHENRSLTGSLVRSVRKACRKLTYMVDPLVTQRYHEGFLSARPTKRGYLYHTDPWALKRQEMPKVWEQVQIEQLRGIRRRR